MAQTKEQKKLNEKIFDVCVNSLGSSSDYKGISEEIFEDDGKFF